MEKVSPEQAYHQMRKMLNEKQWRQYLAVEAKLRGSPSVVAREAGVSLNTVKRGLKELEAGENYQPGERIRKAGGGKKKLIETDATLLLDLEEELEPKGDPMRRLALDEQVAGPSGSRLGSQRAPDQEISAGRALAYAWVFFACQ